MKLNKCVVVCRAIGQGAFGKVCEGLLHNVPGETTGQPVAVKVLLPLDAYATRVHSAVYAMHRCSSVRLSVAIRNSIETAE